MPPLRMGLALLAWCCLVAAAEAASSDALGFRFASFPPRSRDSLVLSGAASLVPPLVVLTSNITGQAGVAWNQHRVWADEFVCNFTFSVDADLGEGGDGVALVFFGAPGARPTGHSVAEQAGGLGYGSGLDEPGEEIPFSVAIEFDTHYDETLADPSQQHVALHSLGSSPNSANESVARIGPLGLANVPPSMRRSPQTVLVTYRQQQLTVTLSSFQAPALQVAVDLLGMTGTAGGDGLFVGISASTGTSSRDRHVLRQWSFAYTGDTLSPKNSRVYGSGWTALQVTAGQQQSFFIDARDLYNHSFAGSPNVFYALIGEISVPAVQSESDASLYKVVFEGAKAGQLVLQVLTFDDVLVATSHTVCVPGPLDPDASQLGGDWRGGTVGRSYVFTVTMTDGYGNRVEPGRTVALAVDFSPSGPEADQQPCGNCKGVYSFVMESSSQGTFGMTVRVDGVVVQGSPFVVSFSGGQVAPERATVGGSGVAGGVVGSPVSFVVQLRDQFSNPVSSPANVSVAVSGNGQILAASVSQQSPGRYGVSWTTRAAGYYSYAVRVNGVATTESPVAMVRVSPLSVASASSSFLLPPDGGSVRVGVAAVWQLVAADSFNNTLFSSPRFDLKVVGSVSGALNFSVFALGPGVAGVELVPLAAETLVWSVSIEGAPLAGSPFAFVVQRGFVSVAQSRAYGPGLDTVQNVGVAASFALELKDEFGTAITDTAGVIIDLQTPFSTQVRGGVLHVDYTLQQAGAQTFRVTVAAGPAAGMSVPGLPALVVASDDSGSYVSMVLAIGAGVAAALSIVVMLLLLGFRSNLVMRSAIEAEKQTLFVAADETEGDNN